MRPKFSIIDDIFDIDQWVKKSINIIENYDKLPIIDTCFDQNIEQKIKDCK